ncbi:MAG: hypothetical protein F8N36_07905 [Desulfovibrio sp.]|uniref:hypothetical protein n=1 Tax=Desulfovibrio sp. TaxID=885 RepID=UPI00135D179B|nr:hypothetical protein [Desulfovibrio sp.]MTJ92771.1 hypothetical protein [Desulfovibrio sp.]
MQTFSFWDLTYSTALSSAHAVVARRRTATTENKTFLNMTISLIKMLTPQGNNSIHAVFSQKPENALKSKVISRMHHAACSKTAGDTNKSG